MVSESEARLQEYIEGRRVSQEAIIKEIREEKDKEIDEEWITLDVTIEGEIEEILDKYDKYTDNFVYEIPWPERDRIRFIYNIV